VDGRESAGPEEAGPVTEATEATGAVARLDGIGAERDDAPVAQFGAALAERPEHVPADLTGLVGPGSSEPRAARVAALGGDPAHDGPPAGPQEGSAKATALFDAERLAAPRENTRVARLTGAGSGRRGAGRSESGERPDPGARRVRRRTGGRGQSHSTETTLDAAPRTGAPEEAAGAQTDAGEKRGRGRGRQGRDELDPEADPVAVAREICLRLLTERARTRQELAQALRRKGVPDDAATTVLERFDEVGLVDDAAFAGQWVRSRHLHRGLARRALAVELRRKGVSDEDAGEALAEVDAESEERRARDLVDRKLRSVTLATADQRTAAARRLVGMLARKGYGAGVAYRVVREALAEHGADVEEFGAEPVED
jgi:regulatory protein